jgi:hypothetical protein
VQLDYPVRETMRERLEPDRRAINRLLADPDMGNDPVLEQLPNGEHASLRRSAVDRFRLDLYRVVIAEQGADPDPRNVVTDAGRRAVAEY